MIKLPPEQIDIFCRVFNVPEFVKPWLHRFFEEVEIGFVSALEDEEVLLGRKFMERCRRRGIVDIYEDDHVVITDFHSRLEIWALFEGWQDIPEDVRFLLREWELTYYIAKNMEVLEKAHDAGVRDRTQVWPEYVLLDEACAVIDRVKHIYLWPCACRAIMKGCRQPANVCLRFENKRGIGWEISRERAREILSESHKKGLMQTAELGWLDDGTIIGGICNCCGDCCFPQQLATHLEVESLWPLNRYFAWHDDNKCSACLRCTKRCPFQAFTRDRSSSIDNQTSEKKVRFDADLCRGCGVCVGGCPESAIEMKPLSPSEFSIIEELLTDN